MKTIEKMAIEQIATEFAKQNSERIKQMISTAQAVQIAKKNYSEVVSTLLADANTVMSSISDELSPEGLTYFYERMKELSKIPFQNTPLQENK